MDANYRFIYVDIGSYGKASDSAMYTNSSLYRALQNQTLNIPPPHLAYQNTCKGLTVVNNYRRKKMDLITDFQEPGDMSNVHLAY